MSKDIPIIFSAPMVNALLDGRKTMTRRLAWGKPMAGLYDSSGGPLTPILRPSPWQRVKPGDRLWVRETWRVKRHEPCQEHERDWQSLRQPTLRYTANGAEQGFVGARATGKGIYHGPVEVNRPSIHMPRWASRLTLVVTATKIERLKEISREDAIAEGCTSRPNCSGFQSQNEGWSMDWSAAGKFSKHASGGPGALQERDVSLVTPVDAFGAFINELYGGQHWNLPGKPQPIWDANPEVVALTFTVHKQNIDAMKVAA